MNMKTSPNDNTFPFVIPRTDCEYAPGLTKREYFAAMAMPSVILVNCKAVELGGAAKLPSEMASDAVGIADALIAALNEEKSKSP